jgi:hypothetical protein
VSIPFEELYQEREWRRCSPRTTDCDELIKAFTYFCENYWYIKHPERGRIQFQLYDSQTQAAQMWLGSRYSLLLKARQLGFSTLVATYCFWLTFFYSDRVIIMLSRTERDAIKLLAKAKYGFRFLPEWMKFRGPPANMTQTKMEFANESYMESLPSMSDPARGETVYLAVVDELAYLPNDEEAWSSIEPIADIGGRVIAMSTANGEGNLFHGLWIGSQTRSNRFKSLFFPWHANGRDQDWYERQKKDLPDWQLAQEYPDNADDAFLRTGRPVFNLEMLRAIEPVKPIKRGFLEKHRQWEFLAQDDGPLAIWSYPDAAKGRYVIGADISEGLPHGDYTSAHVINARTGEVCAHWHGRIDPDLMGSEVLAPLGHWYGDALVGVENNNHGLTTLKALQRTRYHPLYMQRSPRYKRSIPTEILGYRTSQVTKPIMMDELNKNLRDGTIKLWCAETIAELRTFVRNDANRMTGSPFDDRVISLAIANQMLHHVWLKEYEPKREPGPGTMGYFEKQVYGDDPLANARHKRPGEPETIGKHFVRDPIYTINNPRGR